MRRFFYTFWCIVGFSFTVLCQQDSTTFVGFRNGKIQYVDDVNFVRDAIIIDGAERIPKEEVIYYQNRDGFFKQYHSGFNISFLRRELKGARISTFSRFVTTANPGYWSNGVYFGGVGATTSKIDYYSKDGGPVTKLKVANLAGDLADNPLSMNYIKKAHGVSVAQTLLYLAGAGLLIGTLSSTVRHSEVNNPDQMATISPLFFVSAGILWIPYLIRNKKTDHLYDAIIEYNSKK